jgi:DNA adenine methylase
MTPFLKWAGGKRWLVNRPDFQIAEYTGTYIEPFLGGGAVFFHHRPKTSKLSDINARLVDTYKAIKSDWKKVYNHLKAHQLNHSEDHYYRVRENWNGNLHERAAQFLYLNRTCWNGLYRENLKGQFNVPKGTKSSVISYDDDFATVSKILKGASIECCDFETTIENADRGDFVFIDPPYITSHNNNGFVKYNENIFTWQDQLRLRDSVLAAVGRGAKVLMTNADHESVRTLYRTCDKIVVIERASIISGINKGRGRTTELLLHFNGGDSA